MDFFLVLIYTRIHLSYFHQFPISSMSEWTDCVSRLFFFFDIFILFKELVMKFVRKEENFICEAPIKKINQCNWDNDELLGAPQNIIDTESKRIQMEFHGQKTNLERLKDHVWYRLGTFRP